MSSVFQQRVDSFIRLLKIKGRVPYDFWDVEEKEVADHLILTGLAKTIKVWNRRTREYQQWMELSNEA